MEIVVKQGKLKGKRITYQADVPQYLRCKKCRKDYMLLLMQVQDDKGELVKERPVMVVDEPCKVWPHDCSVVNVYLCTHCGAMRANWNQG